MSPRKPKKPEPVYFTDRSFGPTDDCDVVQILREGGMAVVPHDTVFTDPDHAPNDEVWVPYVAENGLVALSTDEDIKKLSHPAFHAIMTYGVKAFWCIARNHDFPTIARNLVNSRHKLIHRLHKYRRSKAFVGRVYVAPPEKLARGTGGEVNVYKTYEQWIKQQEG